MIELFVISLIVAGVFLISQWFGGRVTWHAPKFGAAPDTPEMIYETNK